MTADLFAARLPKGKKITADDIRDAMEKQWPAAQWAIMWEVRETTGFANCRSADAVMFTLWPSMGFKRHGVEIKVSRADWKKELADPTKAEAIAKYMDEWWIHACPGVVHDISEIPPAWGLRIWDGVKWRTAKKAEKTDALDIDRELMASILRRSDAVMKSMVEKQSRNARDYAAKLIKQAEDRVAGDVKQRVGELTKESKDLRDQLANFEKHSGFKVNRWNPDMAKVGKAAYYINQLSQSTNRDLARSLREAADALDAARAICKVDEVKT